MDIIDRKPVETPGDAATTGPPRSRPIPTGNRTQKRKRRRTMWMILGAVFVVGLIYLGVSQSRNVRSAASDLQTAVAHRADLIETISATGSVKAQTGAQVNIGSDVTGRIRRLYADVGSHVKAGQVIAELDVPDLKAQTRTAEDTLIQNRERLGEQQASADMQSRQNDSTLRNAEEAFSIAVVRRDQAATALNAQQTQSATDLAKAVSALDSARLSAEQAKKASDLHVAIARAGLRTSEANQKNAAATLDRRKNLFSKGYVSASDLDQAQAQADSAAAQVDSDRQNVDLVQSNEATNVKTAANQVVQAEAGLTAARAEELQNRVKRQELRSTEMGVRQAAAQLDSARAGQIQKDVLKRQVAEAQAGVRVQTDQLNFAQAQLHKAFIRTPVSGTVLTMAAQQGETLVAGFSAAPVITVADLTRLEVTAAVDETDIGKVKLGQPVAVTVDAFPSEPFEGKLTKIASGATLQQNVVTYAVTVAIRDPKHRLKPDMTASVVITVGGHKNALVVPNEAIKPDKMDSVVGILRGDSIVPEKVKVTIGAADNTNTEILSGIKEGDKVVLAGWSPAPPPPPNGQN